MRRLLTAGGLALGLIGPRLAAQGPAPTPFGAAKAEGLLRQQLPCLGCHTLKGEGGRIGPDLTTVRERRSSAYIAAMIDDPQRVVPGSAMPRTLMPGAVRDLLVRYLSALPAASPAPDAAAPAPDAAAPAPNAMGAEAADGPALYARWCAACHGASGKGDGPNAAALPVKPARHAARQDMEARSDDALYDTIFGGGAIMDRSPRMPAFGATLTDAEIRALVAHIRTLCGCRGPAWSRDGAR